MSLLKVANLDVFNLQNDNKIIRFQEYTVNEALTKLNDFYFVNNLRSSEFDINEFK